MTIDEIALTSEDSIYFEKLKNDFNIKYQNSPAKKALLLNEIKGYSLLFDEENLPLKGVLSENDFPLKGYSITEYCSMQIWLIREFWMHFIVEGNDIAEVERFESESWYSNLNDIAPEWLTNPKYYYSMAVIYCKYIHWLNMKKKAGVTIPELALLKVYEGESMKKDNTKLYQYFARYSKRVNRVGLEDSQLKNKNKIELFENVIKKLSGDQKDQAEKELKEIKNAIENQGFII
jgi:hypothetical protein